MNRFLAAAVAVAMSLLAGSWSALHAQFSNQRTALDRVVSPTVVATYVIRPDSLTLLVLLRGRAGWFAGAGGRVGSGGSVGGGPDGQSISLFLGGRSWNIDIDYRTNTVQLFDREISLSEANVVLVDEVDTPQGARVIDTLWVDPALGREIDPLPTIVGRAPSLADFLQCDAEVSDPAMATVLPAICRRITGR